jgi:hypothetical protein
MAMKTGGQTFRVGDRVRFRFGLSTVTGTIVEDRGCIGVGGRRLFGVKAVFDPPNTIYLELPESELTAVK